MNQTPTDAELMALVETHLGLKTHRDDTVFDPRTGRFHEAQRYRDFASAVLAKWGQPAQAVVGGKPVYQASYKGGFWQDSSRERHEYLKTPEGSWATDWELRVLYTAPQPVAREPLADEWIRSRCKESWIFDAAKQWVRMTEAEHGIKGDQHGTDN